MAKSENLYSTLGIQRQATETDIKKAYRQLAFKFHPDKNPDQQDNEKFQKITNAYSVLSDPDKRRNYDMFGNIDINIEEISPFKIFDEIFKSNPGMGNPLFDFTNGFPGSSLNDSLSGESNVGGGFMGSNLFCMTGNIDTDLKSFAQKFINLRPIIKKVEFTLEECYSGCEKAIEIERSIMVNGKPIKQKDITYIKIPKGVKNKQRETLKGEGNEDTSGKKGDLILIFIEQKHPIYERVNNNLIMEKQILLSEALGGLEFICKTIFNSKLILETSPEEVLDGNTLHTLEGFGLPEVNSNVYGHLFIKYKIIFPKNLDIERKKLLNKILPQRKPIPLKYSDLIRKKITVNKNTDLQFPHKPNKNQFMENIFQNMDTLLGGEFDLPIPNCVQQ